MVSSKRSEADSTVKNQNDLIVIIVSVVLALIAIATFYFTKPEVKTPAPPEQVITTAPQLPAGDVKMAAALPGGSTTGGAAGRGAGAGPRGAGPAAGSPAGGGNPGATGGPQLSIAR